ncbi:hypothetical protein [Flexibacterium corallicola]|uniref:hypothetical protein n=1 Tax=Flexibacterium corallicola TaxID=3037259 RepID=UPI00286F1830|nr:hypothetical protein [Pseudovibrio sp. M1P-2-3]
MEIEIEDVVELGGLYLGDELSLKCEVDIDPDTQDTLIISSISVTDLNKKTIMLTPNSTDEEAHLWALISARAYAND